MERLRCYLWSANPKRVRKECRALRGHAKSGVPFAAGNHWLESSLYRGVASDTAVPAGMVGNRLDNVLAENINWCSKIKLSSTQIRCAAVDSDFVL